MKFLDDLGEAYLKTNADGTYLFYPWGVRGKGYVLPNLEKRREALESTKRLWGLSLMVIVAASLTISFTRQWLLTILLYLVFGAAVLLWWRVSNAKLIEGLATSDVRLTVREVYRNAGIPKKVLVLVFVLVAAMLVGMIALLVVVLLIPKIA